MIHENMKAALKGAMIAKEEVKLRVIRGLLAGFTNELVAKRRTPQDLLTDDEAQAVIMRQVKQRKDSIEQFTNGGRADLADAEKEELAILEAFLPAQMSEEEIRAVIEKKKVEAGAIDPKQMGQFTGSIIKELKGKADGALVKKIADEMFAK